MNKLKIIAFILVLSFSIKSYPILNTLNAINQANREAIYNIFSSIFQEDVDQQEEFSKKENKDNQNSTIQDSNQIKKRIEDFNPEELDQEYRERFTFEDIAGEIPQDVKEIVDFLKNAEDFQKVGAQLPKGILLVGPPGNGKTSIARAIAGEANAKFFKISATDFVEIYVGKGAKRIRELFNKANEATQNDNKAIIFIDELDAIGGNRTAGECLEYRTTLNELLNQMDGFNQNNSILVIAATNTPEFIDSALKRPGRFDRIVEIGLPNSNSRKQILELYCKKIKCDNDIDLDKLAQLTDRFSCAELKNFVNEAAFRAGRLKDPKVRMSHFYSALNDLKNKQRFN